jgi:hypothetical protein
MTNKALHTLAIKQFQEAVQAESEIRKEAEVDVQFRAGRQWDDTIKAEREAEGKPALSFPKSHIFIQSVANESRQNKPGAKVNPISGGATVDTANVLNGIYRHVQYRSKADSAADQALDNSTGSSFGIIRAVTEYSNAKTFDQDIRIMSVVDPFAVYGVIIATALKQEVRHAFVISTITKSEYERKYGPKDHGVDWEATEWTECKDWLQGENVRVAEYWYIVDVKKTLRVYEGPDGELMPAYVGDKGYDPTLPYLTDPEGKVLEREVDIPTVKFCTMDGTRILPKSETTWAGDCIPIWAVLGQVVVVKGKVHIFSLIRWIRDAQCLINLYKSAIAEKIGLANKVPYIGYTGQFTDPKWQDANVKNYAFLEANPVTVAGTLAPLPQRQQLEEQIAALSAAVLQEMEDLKSGMGIYDASLGSRGNETSGVGIERRQRQSNVTNYHFGDNLVNTLWEMASALLLVIPKIYDRPGRQVRIVGEDLQQSVVKVNAKYQDPKTGKERHYPLDVGEYDVVVTIGPSHATARLEGAETLQAFFAAAPAAVPLLGDLWVGSLDYPWAQEAARRLKAAAPQDIVNEKDEGPAKIPPAVQQQLEQMSVMIEQLTAALNQAQSDLDSQKVQSDSRERIAFEQEKTKRAIATAELASKDGLALLTGELAAIRDRLAALDAEKAAALAAEQQKQAAETEARAVQVPTTEQQAA